MSETKARVIDDKSMRFFQDLWSAYQNARVVERSVTETGGPEKKWKRVVPEGDDLAQTIVDHVNGIYAALFVKAKQKFIELGFGEYEADSLSQQVMCPSQFIGLVEFKSAIQEAVDFFNKNPWLNDHVMSKNAI